MTGFERASLALIYNIYFTNKVHSTKKSFVDKRFVVETYDEDNKFRKKRYFVIREISTTKIDVALDEGNKYRVYNDRAINNHATLILTEERPNEKVEVDPMDSKYVTGVGAGYRFIMEEYASDEVKITDDEHRKSFKYKIVQ